MPDTYYPSCWVRLQLRFEDYTPRPFAPQVEGQGDPVTRSQFFGLDTVLIPYTAKVSLNSYRQADEATITIPYGALPLDPRTLRQATIQIFAGTVQPGDFAYTHGPLEGGPIAVVPEVGADGRSHEVFRGFIDSWEVTLDGDDTIEISARDISGILIDAEMPLDGLAGIPSTMPLDEVIRALIAGEDAAQGVLPDDAARRAAKADAKRDAAKLQTYLDAYTRKLTRASAADPPDLALVDELTGQVSRLTAALADAKALEAQGEGVPVLAARYGLPGMRGLQVVNETSDSPLPGIGDLKGAEWFDSLGTAKKGRQGAGSKRISYWDFVTDLCVGCGYICYLRVPTVAGPDGVLPPAELVIAEPRTYYDDIPVAGGAIRFTGDLRTFVYGYNVDSLQISRDYTGRSIPTAVIVTAIEDVTGNHISCQFPPTAQINRHGIGPDGNPTPPPGDRVEATRVLLRDRIPGAQATATLGRIARTIYDQLAKGEMKVNVKTSTLSGLPANWGTGDEDMLSIRPADPIRVLLAPEVADADQPTVTTAGLFARLPIQDKITFLQAAGLDQVSATYAAQAATNEQLQDVFRVQEVTVSWDHATGFQFEIAAINFLDARSAFRDEQATVALIEKVSPEVAGL